VFFTPALGYMLYNTINNLFVNIDNNCYYMKKNIQKIFNDEKNEIKYELKKYDKSSNLLGLWVL